jgi:hypothetical protein
MAKIRRCFPILFVLGLANSVLAQIDTSCSVVSIPSMFKTRLAWESPGKGPSSYATPVVANMNPEVDDMPEIIVCGARHSPNYPDLPGWTNEIYFFRGDGSNAATPLVLEIPGTTFQNRPVPGPTVADVDSDGKPELLMVCRDRRIWVYNNYTENPVAPMSLWVVSADLVDADAQRPMLADFNSDGVPEVYVGSDVFQFDLSDPANPALSRVLNGPIYWGANITGQLFYQQYLFKSSNPVAADLLTPADCNGDPDCDGLEIAAGKAIYSIDLDPADGDGLEIKMQRLLESTGQIIYYDGYTSVADIDLDGVLDVLVSSKLSSETGCYVWNKNGFLRFFRYPNIQYNANGAVPCVANVFDDRTEGFAVDLPEIILSNGQDVVAFNMNAHQNDPTAPYWWRSVGNGSSSHNPAVTFDFNGDGHQEIIINKGQMQIFYGGAAPFPPGVDSLRRWHIFGTGNTISDNHPVVADVDNDNEAEIVYTYWPPYVDGAGVAEGRVVVAESDEGPWVPTRKIWNQYNYFVVNVNDDLTIPAQQQEHHLEMPPGSGNRPLNQTLFQVPSGRIPLPDASAVPKSVFCQNDQVQVQLEACNFGRKDLGAGTPVAFYTSDPTNTNAVLLGTPQIVGVPIEKDSCVLIDLVLPPFSGTVYGMVNDDGSQPRPFNPDIDFPVNNVFECHWSNNLFQIDYSLQQPPFELGPDVVACGDTSVLLDAGPGRQSYLWQDGSIGQTFHAQGPGLYWVRVQDVCAGYRTDTLRVQSTGFPVSTGVAVTGTCPGQSNGALSFLGAAQGTAPYVLAWSTGDQTPDLTGLSAGTYSLLVTDAKGCTISETVQVPILEAPMLNATVQHISCFGANNGGISAGVSGGTPGFNFAWSTAETGPNIQNLAPGTYNLTLTYAADHCAETFDFQIQEPSPMLSSGTVVTPGCPGVANGSATLVGIAQGTAPYAFLWSNGDTSLSAGNLMPGTYTAVVTDANGCTLIETVQVGVYEAPLLVPDIHHISCTGIADGAIFTSLSGGTSGIGYQWSNAAATPEIQALDAGLYSLTVTYADGRCMQEYNFQITEPLPLLSGGFLTNAACPDQSNGSVSFLGATQGTVPYTLAWSAGGDAPDLIGIPAGNYTLLITDAKGCTLSETVQVPEHLAPAVVPTVNQISCFGTADGAVSVVTSGGTPGFGFNWSNGETTPGIQNLGPGTYTLDLSYAGGVCVQTFDFQMNEPLPLLSAGVAAVAACEAEANGSAAFLGVAQGMPPYALLWSNGDTASQAEGLLPGIYTLVVTDAGGCTLSESVQVGEFIAPVLSGLATPASCAGSKDGAITLGVSGGTPGFGFNWSNGAGTPDLSALGAGTYSLTLTYANGLCAQHYSFSVTEPLPLLSSGFSTTPACVGQSNGAAVFLGASQGTSPYNLSWSAGNIGPNLTDVPAGTYVLLITDAKGCTMTQTVQVPEYPVPMLSPSVEQVSCFGAADGNISIAVPGGQPGIGFLWSNGQTLSQLQQIQPGTYDLTVTYAAGVCAQILNFEITEPVELLSSGVSVVAACTGESNGALSFLGMTQGAGPFSLLWSTGDVVPDLAGLADGTYTLTVTGANGCTLTVSAEVPIAEPPQIAASAKDVSCFGAADGSVIATVSGGGTISAYTWSNGATGPVQDNLASGMYILTVTYGGGQCALELNFNIGQPPALQVENVQVAHVLCHGESTGAISLTPGGGTAPLQIEWSGGQSGNHLQSIPAGAYVLTLSDANGCTLVEQYTVSQPDALTMTTEVQADTCGRSTGAITLVSTGGIQPYTYAWSNGANTPTLTGLAAGTYHLTISDANQCLQTLETALAEWHSIPVLNAYTDTITCFEPLAAIGVNPDQPNLHYIWAGPSGILPDQPAQVVSEAGAYSVTAGNIFGCTAVAVVLVAENIIVPKAEIGPEYISVPCDAVEVLLDASGSSVGAGLLPQWQHIVGGVPVFVAPGLLLTATAPGWYVFSNLDTQNGCLAVDSVLLEWTPPVQATINVTQISCFGENDGGIRIQHLAGGLAPLEFSIDGQNFGTNPDFTGLAPGTYTVIARDPQGCIWETAAVLTQPDSFYVTLTASDTLIDLGQSVFLTAHPVPPGTVLTDIRWLPDAAWAPATLMQRVKPEGTTQYEVQVTDADGCAATAALVVEVVNYQVYVPNVIRPGSAENGAFTLYTGAGVQTIRLLRVFDRWGSLVFEKRNFSPNDPASGWDGTVRAQPSGPGVFVWYAELEGKDGRMLPFQGDVTVMR